MKKEKKQFGPKMVLPGWQATYGDMITIMMVFFILMYAMSNIDQELFQQFIDSFNRSRVENFGPLQAGTGDLLPEAGPDFAQDPLPPVQEGESGEATDTPGIEADGDTIGDMLNTFMTYMAENPPSDGRGMLIEQKDDYIQISFSEFEDGGVFFPSGQARLTPYAISALDGLGDYLKQASDAGHGIAVEGHTDNQPISNAVFPSNWTLSAVRASAVVEHLVSAWDIDARMIIGQGRGEHFPIGDNNTAEGRAQNRRVEIRVFTQEATTSGAVGSWFVIPGT